MGILHSGGCNSGSSSTSYNCKPTLTNVVDIFATRLAFAAIKRWLLVANKINGAQTLVYLVESREYMLVVPFVAIGPGSVAYGSVVTGTGNSFERNGMYRLPEGFQNEHRNSTLKDGPVNTCTVRNCVINEFPMVRYVSMSTLSGIGGLDHSGCRIPQSHVKQTNM